MIKLIFKLFGSHHPPLKCSHLWGEILQLFNSAQQRCRTALEMKNSNENGDIQVGKIIIQIGVWPGRQCSHAYTRKSYIGSLISIITQDLGSAAPIREGIAQVKPSTAQEGLWKTYFESLGFFLTVWISNANSCKALLVQKNSTVVSVQVWRLEVDLSCLSGSFDQQSGSWNILSEFHGTSGVHGTAAELVLST